MHLHIDASRREIDGYAPLCPDGRLRRKRLPHRQALPRRRHGWYRCRVRYPEATPSPGDSMGPGYWTRRHRDRQYRATVTFRAHS